QGGEAFELGDGGGGGPDPERPQALALDGEDGARAGTGELPGLQREEGSDEIRRTGGRQQLLPQSGLDDGCRWRDGDISIAILKRLAPVAHGPRYSTSSVP